MASTRTQTGSLTGVAWSNQYLDYSRPGRPDLNVVDTNIGSSSMSRRRSSQGVIQSSRARQGGHILNEQSGVDLPFIPINSVDPHGTPEFDTHPPPSTIGRTGKPRKSSLTRFFGSILAAPRDLRKERKERERRPITSLSNPSGNRLHRMSTSILGTRATIILLGNDEVPGLLTDPSRRPSATCQTGRGRDKKKQSPKFKSRLLTLRGRLGRNAGLVLRIILVLGLFWALVSLVVLPEHNEHGNIRPAVEQALEHGDNYTYGKLQQVASMLKDQRWLHPPSLNVEKRSRISQQLPLGYASKIIQSTKNKLKGKRDGRGGSGGKYDTQRDLSIYQGLPDTAMNMPKHPEDNGLLLVNMSLPSNAHPIYQLIKEGREKWFDKQQRQSTTLLEAVNEYKKRNKGLMPPVGFDKWWRFVK